MIYVVLAQARRISASGQARHLNWRAPNWTMKKILIIEDDPIAAYIYRNRLEKEGYRVEVAVDGQSGFDRLVEFRPDGLLLDLMLPKTSGIELLKAIRNLEHFRGLPVIAYTNAFVPNMIEEA